jgi:hypothetical protein
MTSRVSDRADNFARGEGEGVNGGGRGRGQMGHNALHREASTGRTASARAHGNADEKAMTPTVDRKEVEGSTIPETLGGPQEEDVRDEDRKLPH